MDVHPLKNGTNMNPYRECPSTPSWFITPSMEICTLNPILSIAKQTNRKPFPYCLNMFFFFGCKVRSSSGTNTVMRKETPSSVDHFPKDTGTGFSTSFCEFSLGYFPIHMPVNHTFLMVKSPFLMGKSQFLMGKSQFFVG